MRDVAKAVFFVGEGEVETRTVELSDPETEEVVVDASVSAVSAGTEGLLYEGAVPETEASVNGAEGLSYPTRYGYSVVGEVIDAGEEVRDRLGERVHVLHPHQSRFVVSADEARRVPENVSDRDAAFLSNVETAVGFAMDGGPIVGEDVAVFGQGVVGLLTTAVLSEFPVSLTTFEPQDRRREISLEMGADESYTPSVANEVSPDEGYDLAYEVSGNPEALDAAVSVTGYGGRVIAGSWYGVRSASLELGKSFHGNNITIQDSQVSTIAPELRGRWTKERRLELAWRLLERIEPSRYVTESFRVDEAEEAYEAVDNTLCAVFDYE